MCKRQGRGLKKKDFFIDEGVCRKCTSFLEVSQFCTFGDNEVRGGGQKFPKTCARLIWMPLITTVRPIQML